MPAPDGRQALRIGRAGSSRLHAACVALAWCIGSAGAAAQEIVPVPAPQPAPLPSWLRWLPFAASPPTAPASAADAPAAAAPAVPSPAASAADARQAVDTGSGLRRQAGAAERPADGPTWSKLTPAQRTALEPLAREWASIDGNRKQKWLEIAERLPRMSPAEQARMQTRMTEWARMTPQERAQVRLQFQEAKQVAPQNRKESWDAYLALPAEHRRQLAERAAMASPPAATAAETDRRRRRADPTARDDGVQPKSNIVASPTPAAPPRPVAPTVVQAQPGATTTLMSKQPTPPAHQQAGLPKIAATPEFVDRVTLLPQRGPQGAAMRPVAASEPTSRR